MTLNAVSLEWAIDFVATHSDGDLFPKVLEIGAIQALRNDFVKLVEGKDLSSFSVGAHRRFIVPKDEVSYRQATQLHPQDSILLSAVIHQFGQGIENRRLPANRVFSYRFAPSYNMGCTEVRQPGTTSGLPPTLEVSRALPSYIAISLISTIRSTTTRLKTSSLHLDSQIKPRNGSLSCLNRQPLVFPEAFRLDLMALIS